MYSSLIHSNVYKKYKILVLEAGTQTHHRRGHVVVHHMLVKNVPFVYMLLQAEKMSPGKRSLPDPQAFGRLNSSSGA